MQTEEQSSGQEPLKKPASHCSPLSRIRLPQTGEAGGGGGEQTGPVRLQALPQLSAPVVVCPQAGMDALQLPSGVQLGDGGGAEDTVTMVPQPLEPPVPVQISPKVVLPPIFPDICVPLIGFTPDQPPAPVQELAFVELQVSVVGVFTVTGLGEAEMAQVGAGAVALVVVHLAVFTVQLEVQESVPPLKPCVVHVWPLRFVPSHCSPVSIMPLPQTGEAGGGGGGDVGDGTRNGSVLELPLAFVTETKGVPGTAPVGTVKLIVVPPAEERFGMGVVPKFTVLFVGVKPVPVIVTDVPGGPNKGAIRVMAGAPVLTVVKVIVEAVTACVARSTTILALYNIRGKTCARVMGLPR